MGWMSVLADSELFEGSVVRASCDDMAVALCRVEGQVFAVADKCSHAEASLSEGWLEGRELCCPVHDGRFDVSTGKALCFPAKDPIATFETRVADGSIYVRLTPDTAGGA